MNTPTPQRPTSPYYKPMTLALAGAGLLLTVLIPAFFAKLPQNYAAWNASVIGALARFTASRLGFWQGMVFTAVAIALKDVSLYFTAPWWEPYPLSWLYFSGYVLLGWFLLRRSSSVLLAVGTSLGAALCF